MTQDKSSCAATLLPLRLHSARTLAADLPERAQQEFSPVALMPVSDALAAVLAGTEPLPGDCPF